MELQGLWPMIACAWRAIPAVTKAVTKKERAMKLPLRLHAPSTPKFLTAVLLIALALLGQFSPETTFVGQYQFWLAVAAFVIITLDCIVAPDRAASRR